MITIRGRQILAIAKDNDGYIGEIDNLARDLKLKKESLTAEISKLRKAGYVIPYLKSASNPDGEDFYYIANFDEVATGTVKPQESDMTSSNKKLNLLVELAEQKDMLYRNEIKALLNVKSNQSVVGYITGLRKMGYKIPSLRKGIRGGVYYVDGRPSDVGKEFERAFSDEFKRAMPKPAYDMIDGVFAIYKVDDVERLYSAYTNQIENALTVSSENEADKVDAAKWRAMSPQMQAMQEAIQKGK